MNAYIARVLEEVKRKNATEPEFLQTVEEVYTSLEPVVNKHPEYEKLSLLERMAEPERSISFRVSWVDDAGRVQVNRGYRVQFMLQILQEAILDYGNDKISDDILSFARGWA